MSKHDATLSVGAYLRALRQAKQESLEAMARATRVSAYQIEALESDRFSDLPAPVFVKGFIRAYCHVLGEQADEALRRYGDVIGEGPVRARPVPTHRPAPAWVASPVFVSLGLLVFFGAGLLAVNATFKRGPRSALTSQPNPVVKAERPTTSPAPLMSVPSVASASAETQASHRLLVRAIEPTWIRIQSDDSHAVQELLPAGATREWTAERRFLLTVGNAGGIEIELNGLPVPRLGASGAVIRRLELPHAAAARS